MPALIRLAALLLAVSLLPASVSAQGLDGTQWRMKRKNILQLLMFWRTDTLVFKDGRFSTPFWRKRGFDPVGYVGESAWSSVQENESGEKLEWQGTRKGDVMRGTVTWTRRVGRKKDRKKSRMYRWKAKLRKVPVAI